MTDISISKIRKNYGFKNVLNDFSLEINYGEKIALIGPNGCGKTTLFRLIIGEESVDSGQISTRKGINIGMLSQALPNLDNSVLVRDLLEGKLKDIFDMEVKMRELESAMENNTDKKLDNILRSYGKLQQAFENAGGYELGSKISKICNGFKITNEMFERPFNSLSGGEKTIVSLATLIIEEPSVLLLDEPTNHLDIDTLEWFGEYLTNYKGTIVISSHDRYFLDQVVTKTVLIERGISELFHGNYSYYLIENEKRIMNEFADYKNQQKQVNAMKTSIKKLQEFGHLAGQSGGEAFFKRAASIQKRLDKIELLEKPEEKKELPLNFQIDKRSGNDVLVVEDLNINLGEKEIFIGAKLNIQYGEKVCLMGENGSGKSTLIKAILGDINPSEGLIKLGSSINIGYIPQEIKFENEKEIVLDYIRKSFSGDESRLRASLAKFMFYGENVFKRVGKLSGGEKVRLKLFELIQQNANFLIMDEPTNHIDIDTKEMLENALSEYKGTVFFISHDRYFINELAEKVMYIENKKITTYLGNYDYYKEKKS